jgi:hypothetical protein
VDRPLPDFAGTGVRSDGHNGSGINPPTLSCPFAPASLTREEFGRRSPLAPNKRVIALPRAFSKFWQAAAVDRAKLAKWLPSLLDTADELRAVGARARRAGAVAPGISLGLFSRQ